MTQKRDIKYINREFEDFRGQLIEFAKNYFPDSYNDFSETSPGMMFIEMAAYVGDILSFYQDTQLQETFLQYAQNPSNLYSLAYMMGYRPRVTSVSEVELEVTQIVNATSGSSGYIPNWNEATKIEENGQIKANISNSPTFITRESVDFKFSSSYDPTEVTLYETSNGNPSQFLLTKKVKAISGEIKTREFTFSTAEKFTTLEIEDEDIVGVLEISGSNGEDDKWYEVPFLAQDTVFLEETNTSTDSYLVPYSLKLQKVPKRFVTRFTSQDILQIQFGAGISPDEDNTFLPDPTNIESVNTDQILNKMDHSYDPSNFLFTRTYGLAPSNTTLTVRYIVGGGIEANVPANTINRIFSIGVLTTSTSDTVSFNNPKPAQGGRDKDSVVELRENSLKAFAEQQRLVTLQDYSVRSMSLPSRYGAIAKVYATQDFIENKLNTSLAGRNPLSISLYILAYDGNSNLVRATESLKQNLKTYLSQYMIITDGVNIKDAYVVNIGVKYEIITSPEYPARDVLLRCNLQLQKYFDISKWSINEPINLSPIYTLLDKVKGVQTVKNIEIYNKAGGKYSEYRYDVTGALRNRVIYPSYDPCIFEIKFPEEDIEGRVTVL